MLGPAGKRDARTGWSAAAGDQRTSRGGPGCRDQPGEDGPVLATAGPGRPGCGRGLVRMGRDRPDDRIRARRPAVGHLAVATPGHHYRSARWRRGLRRLRAARMAVRGSLGKPADPPVREKIRDPLPSSSGWPARSPITCSPRLASRGRPGQSPCACPACRSWSWPWGPLSRTCCAPTQLVLRAIRFRDAKSPGPRTTTLELSAANLTGTRRLTEGDPPLRAGQPGGDQRPVGGDRGLLAGQTPGRSATWRYRT